MPVARAPEFSATAVADAVIAGTAFKSCERSSRKNFSEINAESILPRRSKTKLRKLPRTESPTSNAPVNTAVVTAAPAITARWIRQKYLRLRKIIFGTGYHRGVQNVVEICLRVRSYE